jgi:hypothetical protein
MIRSACFRTLSMALLGLGLTTSAVAATWDGGLLLGTHGGPGGAAQVTVADLSPGVRWNVRAGLTFSTRDPGNPEDARRVFINDATNGTPQEKGRLWTWSLDLLLPVWEGKHGSATHLFAGPRYGAFTGNFAFIGGNEDFDVREHTWGVGGGLDNSFPISGRTGILVQLGADYYPNARLEGHDTSYAPDNQNVNPRDDYAFADADEAVHQPRFEVRVMAGILVRLGR